MRTLKYLVGAAIGLTMIASGAARADIQNSAHDLSGGTGEICIYCHTPHNGDVTGDAPLWNRAITSTTFTMYSNPATIQMTIAADPRGISLACLSCHDGVTAYNNVLNDPNGEATAIGTMAGARAVGFDGLQNDHPISVDYDNTLDTDFVDAATVASGGLVLYGAGSNELECATCHNPHLTTNGSFLRKSNTNSDLCLTCHVK